MLGIRISRETCSVGSNIRPLTSNVHNLHIENSVEKGHSCQLYSEHCVVLGMLGVKL